MNNSIQKYIRLKLRQRNDENNFRSLQVSDGLIDFYSNDYLGFAQNIELKKNVDAELKLHPAYLLGSTGSRLLSGNSEYVELLEKNLAHFYLAESALIFNSGFSANYGLISTLPYRGDTIIYDELVHASFHDGMRSSKANRAAFLHNDVADLKKKLSAATGLKYVVVESVYSMDGDFAPLKEISDLCEKYNAGLIVDEAHATGLFGEHGAGRVAELQLENKCLARISTFGKAVGAHGAVILCSGELKNFLINYCRSFIYSTALPFHALASIKCAHQLLTTSGTSRNKLYQLIDLFKKQFVPNAKFELITSNSPIQSIVVTGNENVKLLATKIQEQGFDVRPILYPTVAKGKERIRICIHSFNTVQEVTNFVQVINNL
ncbi:MAG: 8-amino-7-oxononanoate synthase [Bacteroidota bacterium]|nr:8-amino-7-oxononanoate synthase [Bacteroidota bacterium]